MTEADDEAGHPEKVASVTGGYQAGRDRRLREARGMALHELDGGPAASNALMRFGRLPSRRKKLWGVVVAVLFGLVALAGLAIYGYGLYVASVSNSTPMLICTLVPVIGQFCMMLAMWVPTGAFFNTYNVALLAWMVLLIVSANVLVKTKDLD
jgi:hypothetical protein